MANYNSQTYNLSIRPGDPSIYLFGIPNTIVVLAASPGGASRTNNVVTFTTSAAHNFVPGQLLEAKGVSAVLGTEFNGFYLITAVPSTTTLTCKPVQTGSMSPPSAPGNTNQPNDTGGGGNVISVAAEQPVAPQQSISVALADTDIVSNKNASLEIFFTGAPGAFEVDFMEADSDTANAYQIGGGGTAKVTVVTANNTARIDLTAALGKFLAANLASRANAVGIVAKLSR